MLLEACFVENAIFYRKLFTLLLAKSNFRASAFRFVIIDIFLLIFLFFGFRFSDSDFHAFAFFIPVFQFLLSKSNFHVSAFQIPIFTLLLCNFSAQTNVYFLIISVCVFSAQVSSNVLALQEVWD